MLSESKKNIAFLTLGLALILVVGYLFYQKEMETSSKNTLNCSKFHKGTYVYYFNGTKPNKRIVIDKEVHLEYDSDTNWIKSTIHRFTDCHYRLEVIELNTNDTARKIGDFIEVKIDRTIQDTMFYRVNRAGKINKGRLVKISNQGLSNLPLTKTASNLSSPK